MHAYDTPGISAHEFMLAVMHDPAIALHIRIHAAGQLCRAGLGDLPHVRTIKIIIDAGYIPTPEEWEEVRLLQRIYDSGQTLTSLGYFDKPLSECTGYLLADMPAKGQA
jgi:hypothetical protein